MKTKSLASSALATERSYFEENRERLMKEGAGKFVLIKGRRVYGFFEAKFDAIDAGYSRFGNVPFFVHKVTEVEEPVEIVSHLIGV
ncbi:MAG: hypothetical protein AB1705_11185 [Verrucomicrobiota bacterium]